MDISITMAIDPNLAGFVVFLGLSLILLYGAYKAIQ
jgi:hypothetical protein